VVAAPCGMVLLGSRLPTTRLNRLALQGKVAHHKVESLHQQGV
jgi:hypothetical protein